MRPAQAQKESGRVMDQVADLILDATKTIQGLRASVNARDYGEKDEDVKELKGIFQRIMEKSDELYKSLDKLRESKSQSAFPDQAVIEDKLEEIEKLRQATRSLMEFLTPPPSDEELKGGALDRFLDLMNDLIGAANHIKMDDGELLDLYEGRIPPSSGKDKDAL